MPATPSTAQWTTPSRGWRTLLTRASRTPAPSSTPRSRTLTNTSMRRGTMYVGLVITHYKIKHIYISDCTGHYKKNKIDY